jgi:chromate reductase, NAD(P)H dehydrogenase (quinone)
MADSVKILGFAGSLRQGSYNRALLRAAQKLAPEGMSVKAYDLIQIPFYNGDVEALGDPDSVADFKDAIRAADGVLMVTPEYNHGVTAVMKNAVDWASRKGNVLKGKPVGIIGASVTQTGTARGQSQLRQTFEFIDCIAMAQPEILVFRAHEKFDAQGNLTDAKTAEFLGKYLEAFKAWVLRLK